MPVTCETHMLVRGRHICPITRNHLSLGAVNNLNMRRKSLKKKNFDLSGKSRVYYKHINNLTNQISSCFIQLKKKKKRKKY